MSLFYFSAKVISKANQSAVASASYRSGQSLYSERDQETKSYRTRLVEPDSFIIAPEHAPEWVYNREKLWNEVEKVERNWNSQLSREVLVALPRELSNDIQKELLVEFVNENFSNNGMVADVSIHKDKEENPHAHIMLTIRPFNEDGSWGKKRIKNEEGKWIHATNWNDRETLNEWRKNFADKVNEYYLKHDITESVSHESYEKQGLDKLPKQRLSRQEYAIEKKEKENASKEGKEYEPKTYYAKQNKEIEKTNKELERISKQIEFAKQKVVSLSEYKENRDSKKIDELNHIRKQINLSSSDWKSIKIVANRVGGFVNFNKARDNISKLDNWKQKIELQRGLLLAEEKVLKMAKHTFENEPSKTLLYGIIPSKFKEDFTEKMNAYKIKRQDNDKAFNALNELYNHSLRVYEIQKQFVNEEFSFLYPQFDNKFENNERVMDLKSKYVETFKSDGINRETLEELENEKYKFKSSYVKLEGLLKDWKDTNYSLVISERTKEKRKGEYRDNYKNFDAEKTYKSFVRYTDTKDQIINKEAHKELLREHILENMVSRYPNIPVDKICEIPSDIQARILELHIKNENTGILSEDLLTVKEKYMNNNKDNNFNKNNDFVNQSNSNTGNDVGGLFDALVNMSKSQETKDNDLEFKRKQKKKPKMLHHREMEKDM